MASSLFVDPENSIRGIEDGEMRQLGISIEILREVRHGVFIDLPREPERATGYRGECECRSLKILSDSPGLLHQSPDELNELPHLFVVQSGKSHHTGSR